VAREADFGVNDVVFSGKTHLGAFLHAGDMALGYDLARFVSADENLDACQHRGFQLPDFLLVKKDYSEARAKRREKRRDRPWKVKRLDMEADDGNYHLRKNRAPEIAAELEAERFLEVRGHIFMCLSRNGHGLSDPCLDVHTVDRVF
jgi:nonsense-mediated mRNA decay protein 3